MRGAVQARGTRLQITTRSRPALSWLRLLVSRRRQARREELEVIERLTRELRKKGHSGVPTPQAFAQRHWRP